VIGLNGDWVNTTIELPDGQWRNELTGDEVRGGMMCLAALLAAFPVGLLVREEVAA
jgi:(1->4)-alpha-D-glucan 1-alpha-D-glucosylmutase